MLKPDREVVNGLALATLSGVFWFTACPGIDLSFLAWIAALPAIYVVERASTLRRAILFAWWSGFIANLGGFYWMGGLFHRFGHMPWPLAGLLLLAFAAYQGLIFLVFLTALRVIRRRMSLPAGLVAPISLVAAELLVPVLFPFYLGFTQSWRPHVIQIADLGGPLAVTALLGMVNGAIYDLIAERQRRLVSFSIAAAVLIGALTYGHLRIRQIEARRAVAPKLRVGIVQSNIGFFSKGSDPARQLAGLQGRSAELQASGAELIVWPETAYPYPISRHQSADYSEGDERRIHRGFDAPLLFGAVTIDRRERPSLPRNTAILLDADGSFKGRFDKIHLLPFGEYIPGYQKFPPIRAMLPETVMQFKRGEGVVTLPLREWRLGPMICYEDIIPQFGRRLAKLQPHLMVNLTNDAWFGDTTEPWEHLGLSVFRAVELRTDLVRAVNTGVSAYIDATGRVYGRSYVIDPSRTPRAADKMMATVALMESERTVYVRVGDAFGWLCAATTAGLLVLSRFKPVRREG